MTANVWINEIDYDQVGTDHDEFIELAGVASTSLTGWKLELYNGNGGALYDTIALDGSTISDQQNGKGTVAISVAGIQNGNPDGIALVDDAGAIVQFLSYGGPFTAVGGDANGLTSTDIGVVDDAMTEGSVQLTGTGQSYLDFTWTFTSASKGSINAGETLSPSNLPATFSGDTSGSVEEYVTPTAKGTLIVTDTDSSPDVVAQVGAASDNGYGTFSINADGDWTFTLTPGNASIKDLNTGDALTDFLSVETADGTAAKIEITIKGITDITGSAGNDKNPPIVGTDVRDLINALKGNDEAYGQAGADLIIGGLGADILHGGKGADSFLYDEKASGISSKTMDRIADFSSKQHDVIDLSAIDAKPTTEADNAFHLLTNKMDAANKLGSVWISKGDGDDIVYINNVATHDGFDMAIDVHTNRHLTADDFIL